MSNLNDLLKFAIKAEAIVKFEYMDSKGKVTTRRVLPKEAKGNKLYGHDLDKEALRSFIIGRMILEDQEIDEDEFDIPF